MMSMHARRSRRLTGLVLSMALLAVVPQAWAAAPQAAQTQAQGVTGYELPSAALQAVVDAPRAPSLYLSPRRDVAALMQMPSLPSIQVVAQPELKLAGLRINPRTFSDSRFSFGQKLWLMNVADGKERQISGLPATLSIASLTWSPDQKWLAFNQVDAATGANELWLVDVAGGSARRLVAGLNTVLGSGYQWLPDSRGLVVFTRPANLGAAPAADGIPTGPAVQQTSQGGGVVSIRTYQDLLKNEAAVPSVRPASSWALRCRPMAASCSASRCSARTPTWCRWAASRAASKCSTAAPASWCTPWRCVRWWKACRPATMPK
jgi:hypothetical protein